MAAFKHTIQHSSNLQIFAKTMSGFKSRFAPGEASWQRGYKIYSKIVRFSSDLVEISSDLVEISSEVVEISSEVVEISSELISRILELMIISTFMKTSESKFRTTFPAIISTIRTFFLINNNCRLLCSFFCIHTSWLVTNNKYTNFAHKPKKKGCFECETAPTYGLITYSSGQSISTTGYFVSQNKECGKNGG